ncbi:hypothetical protein RFI_27898 [Reticulomyxa filosa]|uniref:Uncharacterized protein n=1 Tax=Reticulomyxa filosa TaxID=46433 RepID=X6M661_RETFI|nr:hypothetical protein RFI_27898 [Reticulomyxa filosa]|eukprot:ETO09478.1 hypothetical protein RFI_27898 [Reticulomyxa filosa]
MFFICECVLEKKRIVLRIFVRKFISISTTLTEKEGTFLPIMLRKLCSCCSRKKRNETKEVDEKDHSTKNEVRNDTNEEKMGLKSAATDAFGEDVVRVESRDSNTGFGGAENVIFDNQGSALSKTSIIGLWCDHFTNKKEQENDSESNSERLSQIPFDLHIKSTSLFEQQGRHYVGTIELLYDHIFQLLPNEDASIRNKISGTIVIKIILGSKNKIKKNHKKENDPQKEENDQQQQKKKGNVMVATKPLMSINQLLSQSSFGCMHIPLYNVELLNQALLQMDLPLPVNEMLFNINQTSSLAFFFFFHSLFFFFAI